MESQKTVTKDKTFQQSVYININLQVTLSCKSNNHFCQSIMVAGSDVLRISPFPQVVGDLRFLKFYV